MLVVTCFICISGGNVLELEVLLWLTKGALWNISIDMLCGPRGKRLGEIEKDLLSHTSLREVNHVYSFTHKCEQNYNWFSPWLDFEQFGSCGGNLSAQSGLLTSPHYPAAYPNNTTCVYTISGQGNTYINLTVLTMDIEQHVDCSNDFVEIRGGRAEENSQLIDRLCGKNTHVPGFILSTDNTMWIKWGNIFLRIAIFSIKYHECGQN